LENSAACVTTERESKLFSMAYLPATTSTSILSANLAASCSTTCVIRSRKFNAATFHRGIRIKKADIKLAPKLEHSGLPRLPAKAGLLFVCGVKGLGPLPGIVEHREDVSVDMPILLRVFRS
jgi:hypothetical protein